MAVRVAICMGGALCPFAIPLRGVTVREVAVLAMLDQEAEFEGVKGRGWAKGEYEKREVVY